MSDSRTANGSVCRRRLAVDLGREWLISSVTITLKFDTLTAWNNFWGVNVSYLPIVHGLRSLVALAVHYLIPYFCSDSPLPRAADSCVFF